MRLTQENAGLWVQQANEGKEEDTPTWSWDCQYKLDFDGGIFTIASRFSRTNWGGPLHGAWDGTMWVYLLGEEVHEQKFKGKDINEVRDKAEAYVQELANKIKSIL